MRGSILTSTTCNLKSEKILYLALRQWGWKNHFITSFYPPDESPLIYFIINQNSRWAMNGRLVRFWPLKVVGTVKERT